MLVAPQAKDPIVLSYLALRKAVGDVAVGLPFALAIPWWVLQHHIIQSSISAYYYTGMRNLFVGSLCAISLFMLCARGYDRKDEIAGVFSALCALGVAFFPTAPDWGATQHQHDIGIVHYVFAGLLFSTLAYFCLVLFKMTAANHPLTRKKLQRNKIYTVCGCVIIASMLLIFVLKKILKIDYFPGHLGTLFCFESTALFAFGLAWLVKGETFLKDENPEPSVILTTTKNPQPFG
ncbi:MAG TPA: hypothetical protein VNX26_00310 [Candidatus Acidoferrum sp.]|jgi:hypothetical protein|nr:hypothetical protein [Candidatus Acidoferrum sp.]